jgi:hypothetical protein
MTKTERKLLLEIRERGRIESLFRLALDLEIDYGHARICIYRLASAGLVSIHRLEYSKYRPLVMEVYREQ